MSSRGFSSLFKRGRDEAVFFVICTVLAGIAGAVLSTLAYLKPIMPVFWVLLIPLILAVIVIGIIKNFPVISKITIYIVAMIAVVFVATGVVEFLYILYKYMDYVGTNTLPNTTNPTELPSLVVPHIKWIIICVDVSVSALLSIAYYMYVTRQREGIYAFSVTCFAFYNPNPDNADADSVEVALIFNENFGDDNGGWWLAPGGHMHLSDGNLPDSVVTQKTKDETGAEIELLSKPSYMPLDKYKNCKSTIPPQAVYLLGIEKSAKCFEQSRHKFHFDLTYIAKVLKKHDDKASKELIWVSLSKADKDNKQKISAAVNTEIDNYYTGKSQPVLPLKHPQDFLDRLYQAFIDYCEL